MSTIKKPPSASFRRNLYWTDEIENRVKLVAEKLHNKGVKGLYNSKGEVNRTAVIAYLLEKEINAPL